MFVLVRKYCVKRVNLIDGKIRENGRFVVRGVKLGLVMYFVKSSDVVKTGRDDSQSM